MTANITLTIERLAGLGDGMGLHEGRKIFVPYTLAGDVAEVSVTRRTKDADYAKLERIVTPAPDRIEAVCRHYGQCGGCALQHMSAESYAAFKQDMAREAVRKAGYNPAVVAPLVTFPAASRRRVEFKVENGKLGYFEERSHKMTPISECKVLEPELEALAFRLPKYITGWRGLQSIQINGLDEGYDLTFAAPTAPKWTHSDPAIRRASLRFNGTTRTLFESGKPAVTFGGVSVEPPPGAFLQAVRGAQQAITALVLTAVGNAASVLDLFSGLGTYSFPLIKQVGKLRAAEGEGAMVQAMREAADRVELGDKFQPVLRDLFQKPYIPAELARHDAVVINPPRNGAAEQCRELAASSVTKIVMVSCNPATFTRDARVLAGGGYKLQKATPIDQFAYTAHLEIIAEFTK